MQANPVATIKDASRLTQVHPNVATTITPSPFSALGQYVPALLPQVGRWLPAIENSPETRSLYRRHKGVLSLRSSSRSRLIASTGDKLVLITPQADALIVFRKTGPADFLNQGVQCVAFRNEGHFRSDSLIREAVECWARPRWPYERFYACFQGRRIVATNPAYAFKCAGWQRCGLDAYGLIVLELLPQT